jgi:DNA mismatch repair protein MutS
MAATLPRIRNFHVAVKETGQQVLFLRKLVPGGSEHSFGIHVAKLAGIPVKVVQRAGEILKQLEDSRGRGGAKVGKDENVQLSFFQLDDPVLEQIREEIRSTDLDHLTPVQALNKLNEIKKLIGG